MSDEDEDFFVGYLPMSPAQVRFTWAVTIAIVCLLLAGGATAAWVQRSPGEGLETYRTGQELSGVLLDRPYPMLVVQEGEAVRHVLLVTQSKHLWRAPASRVGTGVRLQGAILERDGSQMLEVSGRPATDTNVSVEELRAIGTESFGEVTLAGEIVDAKCYYGRMRPGGGRTHRACAQLCVAGGIPPVLVTRDADGRETHYLLASEDGGSVADGVLPWLAEPVRVRGSLSRMGDDLWVLRIDPSAIERL